MGLRSLTTFLFLVPLVLALSNGPVLPTQGTFNVTSSNPTDSPGVTPTIPLSSPASPTNVLGNQTTSTSEPVAPAPTTYPFTPFPTPAQSPVAGVFPATDPSNPPSVGSPLVPDFDPAWAAAYAKAKAKIAKFTLEQKVNVTTGVGWQNGRCIGNIPPVPIDGSDWPGLCVDDSPLGVRFADFVTAFPAGINAAATWNRDLIRTRGLYMGREHVGKGINIALGPMMNLGRVAGGGRNWEGFGADPYLAGEASYETILGMQQGGVQACAKHLINNEQEHFRTSSSSNVDDRTQHEIYTLPFLRSVMAGVASIMCSYNLVNNTYACENSPMMNDIVKREYGFQGYIMSDWQATHSTLSAVAGLDMTMPGDITFNSGDSYFGGNLTAYVKNGTIPEFRVNDMATRILAGWYLLHQDLPSFPPLNFNANKQSDPATNQHVDVQSDHYMLVREMGAASIVLLKNVNGSLPLKKPRSVFIAGSDARPAMVGPNGASARAGDGVLAMGWGSGVADFSYLISPYEALQKRARQDHTQFSWTFDDFNPKNAGNRAVQKSAAIVFINANSGEGYITVDGNEGDRKNLTAWHGGDDLVLGIAAQNPNTIVVMHSVGPLIVEAWIDHPNVTAVLWAGLPGQEAGNAITDVLYGDWNPSGKLPYTIAKQVSDYPAQVVTEGSPTEVVQIDYTEALEIDYRHFDAKKITPRFEFGFGLSYTTFGYSELQISKVSSFDNVNAGLIADWESGKAAPISQGSSTALWLHRPAYTVTFNLKNTGSVYGAEVAQLYINHPASAGEPPSILKGFDNVAIAPGQTKSVTINLSRYDLSIWDTVQQGWVRPKGVIGVMIGASSRDARLHGKVPS